MNGARAGRSRPGKDEQGYHLQDGIVVEVFDEAGTVVGTAGGPRKAGSKQAKAPAQFNGKQRWIMAQLASGRQLTRRDVEQEFGISNRTAKRVLGEMSDTGLIEFNREEHPGFYRLV